MQKSNAWFFQFKFLSMLRSWEFLSVFFIQQKIHYLLHGIFHHLMVVFSSLGQLELSPTCLHLHSTEASILFALFVKVCRFSLLTEYVLLNLNQYYLLVWGKKKIIIQLYLQWLPTHTGDGVLFLCLAGSRATLNSHFGARDGNNIASHPSGARQGDQIASQSLII